MQEVEIQAFSIESLAACLPESADSWLDFHICSGKKKA